MGLNSEISAGGVVLKKISQAWHVLVIKDMNNNWTFPKGIIETSENPLQAAMREIGEETGLKNIKKLTNLPEVTYTYYRNGLRQKTVHYFLFVSESKTEDTLVPQKQEGITEATWMTIARAMESIGYIKTNIPMLLAAEDFVSKHPQLI